MNQKINLSSLTEQEKQTLLNAWKDVIHIADTHQQVSNELRKLVSHFPVAEVQKVASNLTSTYAPEHQPMLHLVDTQR
jgi:hypothetical protein